MNSAPQTLDEWKDYISGLSEASLLSKAIAANSVTFVRALEADGMTPSDIGEVLRYFAVQLQVDGQTIPGRTTGDYLDYGMFIADSD